MTKKQSKKRRRLSYEILGMIGLSAVIAIVQFSCTTGIAGLIVEEYVFYRDVQMTEFDWMELEHLIFSVGALLAAGTFSLLFLSMFQRKIAYIRKITRGIDALRDGQKDPVLPLKGNDELTELAWRVNYLSATQQQLREKEQKLAQEKEQLIRSLSHDIRTPLTAILSYSDFLAEKEQVTPQEQRQYVQLVQQKAGQIKGLTDILLDGGRRTPEYFADGKLLLEQLTEAFMSELEENFAVRADLSGCGSFAGSFDVQELQRIFDNLASNIGKYADPEQPVTLQITLREGELTIRQENAVISQAKQPESHGIGLNSIRRIAQYYAGHVTVQQEQDRFVICVTLCDF